MNWTEKAEQAMNSAATKVRHAKWHRELAIRCERDFRAGYLQAAVDLETDADVDLTFAYKCEQWAKEAA